MQYDFDRIIDRYDTNSSKWDNVGNRTGNKNAIPMWLADADFVSPEPIQKMVVARAEHGIYGYPCPQPKAFQDATIRWVKKRYGYELRPEWLVFTIGIVPILYTMIQAFTEEGDEVILQQPVYHPFMHAIRNQKRVISNNALLYENGRYSIDFADLERRAARKEAKLMLLCSPHNPVGRAWTPEELTRISEICLRNHVLLVSDEIHSDLMLFSNTHTPTALGNPAFEQNTVLCYAPSKTFNIAGLRGSCAVIPNESVRERFRYQLLCNDSVQESIFSLPAYVLAYTECDDYLEQLIPYLEENVRYLDAFLREKMPKIRLVQPDATYLMWLDCHDLGLSNEEVYEFIIKTCGVGVSRGDGFGPEGEQFLRLNIACPRATLEKALLQIYQEYQKRF